MQSRFKNSLTALLLVVLLAANATAADWERGVALYNKGDFRSALAEFQDLVRERPDAAGAWYYIGLCEFKLKRYNKVELPLSRAVELLEVQTPASPDIAAAFYTIGLSHFLLAEYGKSLEPLKRYIEITAKAKREVDPAAKTTLGRAYYFLERFDEALSLLATSKSDNAKEAGANAYLVGLMYFKKEDDDKAILALREAVKANDKDEAALELLAESLMRKARKVTQAASANALWNEAANVGEQLKTRRDDLQTANVLGRAYLGGRQFEKAVAPLERLARENPDNGQAWLYYGIALSRSGKTRKAMEALEITIQLLPDSVPALSELAYVYESDKQYQQALRIYEKAFAATNDPAIKQSIDRVKALATQQP
ncbi:MAG: tetratricopeptide repeat protein [Acidobacteria bacterium]|nr:tetratricopeptide repeat protein [Acidobacteriota bacterium]